MVVSHQTYLQTAAVGYMVGTTRVELISGLKINNALSVQKSETVYLDGLLPSHASHASSEDRVI